MLTEAGGYQHSRFMRLLGLRTSYNSVIICQCLICRRSLEFTFTSEVKQYWLLNSQQRRSNLDLGCLTSGRHTNCPGNLHPHILLRLLPLVLNESHLSLLHAAVWLAIFGCHSYSISLVNRDEPLFPFADSLCDRKLVTAFQSQHMNLSKVSVSF